jgi:gp16 family phage-associated protein
MSDITADRKSAAMKKLEREGYSLRGWSNRNGFSVSLVRAVINGDCPGRINKGHKIAVLLGLKDGVIVDE